jgi:hypothetical protein
MLKNLSRLECIVADKSYQLLCDIDSPLESVKEALFQFQKYIGQVEDAVKKQRDDLAASEASKEEKVAEPIETPKE